MEPPIASSAGPVSDGGQVVTDHPGATERVFNVREQGETGSAPRGLGRLRIVAAWEGHRSDRHDARVAAAWVMPPKNSRRTRDVVPFSDSASPPVERKLARPLGRVGGGERGVSD
eukprot:5313163-Pyramimonas_sp.AAC.1